MSTERVIVQRDIAPALLEAILELIGKIRAGDTHSGNAQIGALFSEGAAEKVLSMIMDAENDGAKILHGDKAREGALIQPHVVINVKPGMRLWDRESFGPGESFLSSPCPTQASECSPFQSFLLLKPTRWMRS
jgi:acyl-CoA reductase-like NAD-dependent aldehyde dehydrogenase